MSNAPRFDLVPGHGGTGIGVHRLGSGFPVVMLHGLASSADTNWIRYGHAAAVAAAGFEAVMLDMRGHGRSEAPHDPAAYPRDVAMLDVLAVLGRLGIADLHLVGYSLGARISTLLVADGLRPRRLVLAGMGLELLTGWLPRRDHYLRLLARFDEAKLGDSDYLAIQFIRQAGVDPEAMALLLGSMVDVPAEILDAVTMPTLVVAGEKDDHVGSIDELAARLPDARPQSVPGNHMYAVTKPELGAAIVAHLST